jgi:hypothetical protein
MRVTSAREIKTRRPHRTTAISPRFTCARRVQGETERFFADSSIESNSKSVIFFACTSHTHRDMFSARSQDLRRYLAQIKLQRHLAQLPESISLSGNEITGVLGPERRDLSSLREPFHTVFANWRTSQEGILKFTSRYGLLDWDAQSWGLADTAGREFRLRTEDWRDRRGKFLSLWETAAINPHGLPSMIVPSTFPLPRDEERGWMLLPATRMEDDSLIWKGPETTWRLNPKGSVAYIAAKTTWQFLCLLLSFETRAYLRKCENPDCAAPYFIARRKDQRFCGEDCSRLIVNRRWWRKHGNDWRQATRQRPTRG